MFLSVDLFLCVSNFTDEKFDIQFKWFQDLAYFIERIADVNAVISECLTEGGELNLHAPGIGKCYEHISLKKEMVHFKGCKCLEFKMTSGWNISGLCQVLWERSTVVFVHI